VKVKQPRCKVASCLFVKTLQVGCFSATLRTNQENLEMNFVRFFIDDCHCG
jgi:hypothetical protein